MEGECAEDLRRLAALVAARRGAGGPVAVFRKLAIELGAQASPPRHWSWQYVHQVSNKKLSPSHVLRKAIRALYEIELGANNLVPVTVLAPGNSAYNHIILRLPPRICARPGCGVSFIPNSPNQKFHSTECRKISRQSTRTRVSDSSIGSDIDEK